MGDVAIRFEHVSKRFALGERFDSLRDLVPALARRLLGRGEGEARKGDFWALKDVNLEVRKGEALGIVGHNGAGKSTMLKHLAGIMVPTKGRIEVDGRLSALIEVGAGFHPDLTGRENVYLNGVILGMTRTEVARKFDEIVDFSGLEAFIDTPVKRYSSGMYARLGFSVAAHLDPDILVIDEVLSVGDFVFRQKSLMKMRSVAAGGATVLLVSHNLRNLIELCPRSVLLEGGSMLADGDTPGIIQAYLARERAKLGVERGKDVAIQSVVLRGPRGPESTFRPGDQAWIDITFRANRDCVNVATILQVLDDGLSNVLHTSSERLGEPPVALRQGQSCTVRLQLAMHLAGGTYHIGVRLYRYDIQREFDRVLPAVTFVVESDVDTRGSANLYPRLAEHRVT
jgi:ABC-type polysaccharide/polyol phosphate transport system ATPase subunit